MMKEMKSGSADNRPASGNLCRYTARLHNRPVCRHNIDHVVNDEHNRIIIVVLAKHEIAP